ncbi:MAG: tetratricopeptide repeat protein [Myxococcota bacterium]
MQQENNIPGAIGHLRTAIELDDENAEAHLLMAIVQHVNRNNSAVAEEHARRGVEILLEQERHGSTLAEARNILGTILIARGNYDDAINQLDQSAMDEMNTSPHLAWGNLGLAHIEAGNPQLALEPLQEAVRMQPRFCVGFHRLGRAHFAMDNMEMAEAALVQALEADESCSDNPSLQNAWRLRGEVRARLGRRDEALSDLERCVALGAQSEDGTACQRLLDNTPPEPAPEDNPL